MRGKGFNSMYGVKSMEEEWKGWKDFLGLKGDDVSDKEFMGDDYDEEDEEDEED